MKSVNLQSSWPPSGAPMGIQSANRVHKVATQGGVDADFPRLLLNINEVAASLGVSRRTAYELKKRADFPPPITLAQRCVRFRAEDVRAFAESLLSDAAATSEPDALRAARARRNGLGGGDLCAMAHARPDEEQGDAEKAK